MSSQQMQTAPPKDTSQTSLMLDGIFDTPDQQFLGYTQLAPQSQQQAQQKPNSVGRHGPGPQMGQARSIPPQHQQPPLDKANQEQLMKMRLQIMQQQIIQGQQPQQQQSPLPHQMIPPYQQNRMLPNMGYDSSLMGSQSNPTQSMIYQDNSKSAPPGAVQNQQISELVGPSSIASPASGMGAPYGSAGAGSSMNMPPGAQGIQKVPFKPTPAQITQLQHDLFSMSLNDFMSRKGTPITQPPIIGNKRVNLFALQVLGRKIGGSSAVLKHLQALTQPSLQFSEWSSICQKLGLFVNIDVKNNVMAKQQVEKQLGTCYLQYILPYEQYALTDEGQKDLQVRRAQFQKQLILRMQQQQMNQSQQGPQGQNQNLNQNLNQPPQNHQNAQQYNSTSKLTNRPGSGQNQMNAQALKTRVSGAGSDIAQSSVMAQKNGQFQSPTNPNLSPHPNFIATPNVINNPSPSVPNGIPPLRKLSQQSLSAHNSPAMIQSPYAQPTTSKSSNLEQHRPLFQQNVPSEYTNATPRPHEEEAPPGKPNTIKKYTPIKKVADLHGYFVKKISEMGDEIDVLKPVYLFAPELGALNLHALTMSLKNYTANNEGEAFPALNTLVVTTADDNFSFDISEAPELISALVSLGNKVLKRITHKKLQSQDYFEIKNPSQSSIDSVFDKYVSFMDMQGEDVAFVVDSLTGNLIVDDDSEIEIDEVFSPLPTHTDSQVADEEDSEEINWCSLPDYMTAMHQFRSENKHHFSKMQIKGPLNEQVFFVDTLITVSMTLRNLSLSQDSAGVMAKSSDLKSLVFDIVKLVATCRDCFVFERKRLCLLKDCLVILNNHGSQIELQSLEEAFLLFLLVSAFGPKLDEIDDETDSASKEYQLAHAPLDHYTYLPYAVDVFTKLLVREPKNRAYLQAVMTGTLNITLSAVYPNSNPVPILPADHQETQNLITAYFHGDLDKLKKGELFIRAFNLLMSAVPFPSTGAEFSKVVLLNLPAILQALFGTKLLMDLIPSDDANAPISRVIIQRLTSNVQVLIFNFTKSIFGLITEAIKLVHTSAEHKIAVFVSIKALIMINSFYANAVRLRTTLIEGELEESESVRQELAKFASLYRIQCDGDFLLNSISVSGVDPDLAEQILRLRALTGALRDC